MKRYLFLHLTICFNLAAFLLMVYPVSAAGIPTPMIAVKAEILHCNLEQGWCSRMPQVHLTASASGTTVQAIEGSLNGNAFKGEGAEFTLDLVNDSNHLSYWAVSASGIKSPRRFISLRMEPKNVLSPSVQSMAAGSSSSSLGKAMPDGDWSLSAGLAGQGTVDASGSKSQLSLAEALASLSSNSKLVAMKESTIEPVKFKGNVISYIFNQALRRKQKPAAAADTLLDTPPVYSLVLDETPPQLTIAQQDALTGKLTFSGLVADDVSGLKSLMMNINGQWQPLDWRNSVWNYVWDTEKAQISSGAFTLHLLAEDVAGNTQTASQDFQVLNRTWPLFTLWALLLALAFTALFDPRRKAWRELSALSTRMVALGLVDYFKEEE